MAEIKAKKVIFKNRDGEYLLPMTEDKTGLVLFDTILKDHILTYEESKGLTLQGTYVYKKAIAGSRYGYPDFYNRCLEEYNASTKVEEYFKPNVNIVGYLTDSKGVLGGFTAVNYAILPNLFDVSNGENWEMVIKFKTPTAFSDYQTIFASSNTKDYQGIIARVTAAGKLNVYLSSNGTSWDVASNKVSTNILTVATDYYLKMAFNGTDYTFDISTDNSAWTNYLTVTSSVSIFASSYVNAFGISVFQPNYYWKGSIDLNESYININGERWWSGINTYSYYKNDNTHKFYDIADKPYIDAIYESTGIADFYGIDTENERIFLARETDRYLVESKKATNTDPTWYNLYSDGWIEQGGAVATNKATTAFTVFFTKPFINTDYYFIPFFSSTADDYIPKTANKTETYINVTGQNDTTAFTWQANGYTNIPTNLPKYKYICVGNTKAESAISNVTEITTSENDTLPLFYNFYSKEDMTTTGAYVNASLGSYLSGNVYATAYNELVKKLGSDNVKSITDDYTDYDFVVNQDEMSFRLPLKNGQEIMFATGVKGNGMTLGLTNGTVNYGLASSDAAKFGGATNQYGQSVGVAQNGNWQPTNGAGYGITTDPTKSGIELDTENITIPDGWNLYYKVANAVTNLEILDVAKVMDEAVLRSSLVEAYVVTETYQNGSSWYRIWSDGWCEQGGTFVYVANPTINLLVPYKNAYYSIQVTDIDSADTGGMGTLSAVASYTNSSITFTTTTEATEIIWEAKGYMA